MLSFPTAADAQRSPRGAPGARDPTSMLLTHRMRDAVCEAQQITHLTSHVAMRASHNPRDPPSKRRHELMNRHLIITVRTEATSPWDAPRGHLIWREVDPVAKQQPRQPKWCAPVKPPAEASGSQWRWCLSAHLSMPARATVTPKPPATKLPWGPAECAERLESGRAEGSEAVLDRDLSPKYY